MAKTLDLGRRIELFSLDRYCDDISLALYCQYIGPLPTFLVHTYSSRPGAQARANFVSESLQRLVGLQSEDRPGWLKFPCQSNHQRALKRAFLDVCKLEPGTMPEVRPLTISDKKAGCNLTAVSLGNGVYQINAAKPTQVALKRADAMARGFVKLCDMHVVDDIGGRFGFPCQSQHDEMIGMLMVRAQNARAAVREEQLVASRGILAAPSQQDT